MNMPHETGAGGSPLYFIEPEHAAALLALVLFAVGAAITRRRREVAMLAPIEWLLVALLAGSSAIHAGLAIGDTHHGAAVQTLFLVDAILLAFVAHRVLRALPAGRLGVLVLAGSVVAYWGSTLAGNAPDQLGIATKLVVGRRVPCVGALG
jgi:hypothetical protein